MPTRIYKLINFCRCILVVIPCLTRNPVFFLSLDSRWSLSRTAIRGGNDSTTLSLVPRKLYKLLLVILILGIFPASVYSGSDWKITFKVSGGGTYDYCVAGVKDVAKDEYDSAWDIPARPGNLNNTYIYAYFPHTETGWDSVFDKFRQDIKDSNLPKEWIFEVSSNIPGELTIQWPDLKNTIPDKDAVLVVKNTDGSKAEINMKTLSSFVFVNNVGYTRQFLIRISQETPPVTPEPNPPEGLTGTWDRKKAAVLLYWNGNLELDLAGYNLYRSTTPGSGYQRINYSLISTTNHKDNQIVKGKTYYYVVTAVNTSGRESGYSNEVKVIVRKGK